MNITEIKEKIASGVLDAAFTRLYGAENIPAQRARYTEAADSFAGLFGSNREIHIFSVPGRSEVSGNHTDHNHGRVLAAAVNLDIIAVVSARDDDTVTVKSKGFEADTMKLSELAPVEKENFHSASLIRGVADGMKKNGHKIGGFDAYTTSNVLKGSGLSSSAAFEVIIGTIHNYLYNEGSVGAPEIARIAQYAENVYFGKPSGLMDQTACAVGGFIAIDFEDPKNAKIEKIPFDLTAAGYRLCITDTGGNHADLNEDYASVPAEMKLVASKFGKEVLRGLTKDDLLPKITELRAFCGDRAVLRALHFVAENDRVAVQADALRKGDFNAFLGFVRDSGRSSFMWLQNVYTTKNVSEQGVTLALCITEQLLAGSNYACRVHGGGFAGTMQAFVPEEKVASYREGMETVFGKGACTPLSIRADGAVMLF